MAELKMNLSPKQREIVEAPVGHMLVLATAGSGKTRVLTERVRFLLERDRLDGVLALTFTNKAADEMRERLKGIENLDRRTFVGTIHGFAQSIIEKHGRHIGYDRMPHIFERDEDRGRFIVEAVNAYAPGVQEASASYGGAGNQERVRVAEWLGKISQLKRSLYTDEQIEAHYPSDNTLLIFREYNALLRQQGGVDFDDLLVLAYRILTEMPSVAGLYARSYPHVCIDEAQDLNNAQYQLIRALCLSRAESLLMVGDPNQAIYGFNGSSADYMTKLFISDFRPTTFKLLENYRSTKQVLRLAVALKPGSHDVGTAPLLGRAELYAAEDESDEARWICDRIQELRDLKTHPEIEGIITLEKMTVLARNRYVFKALQEELGTRGLLSHLKRGPGAPVFESRVGRLVDLTLRVILNPLDMLHFLELCSVLSIDPVEEVTADKILDRWATMLTVGTTELGPYVPTVINLMKQENQNNQPNLERVLAPIRTKLIDGKDSGFAAEEVEPALNDLDDLRDHWDRYVHDLPSAASLSLTAFRNAMAMGKTHPETVPDGLALSTVHTMKGLEKDIVFLMGMGQGTFPDYRAVEAGGAKLLEEKNNAYVAITRARRFIYISYPKTKKMPWGNSRPQQPSVFLKQMGLV
jgi:DNA helicase-2/ATP-dependent DNA helicase PcrA